MAVSPLTAQTQGNHKSNNVCACVCLCVFACACACTCLGVCVWKEEEEEEEAINVFTWSECLFARVVLNKKLNHDQHKLIKPCSLEPYSSHVQKSNPQLLPLDEEMKKTPRNMLISQGWAEEKGNAHVKHAWPSALTCASHFAECVVRDWWSGHSSGEELLGGMKRHYTSPALTMTRRHWLFTLLTNNVLVHTYNMRRG